MALKSDIIQYNTDMLTSCLDLYYTLQQKNKTLCNSTLA